MGGGEEAGKGESGEEILGGAGGGGGNVLQAIDLFQAIIRL